jgi:hypothetical protein
MVAIKSAVLLLAVLFVAGACARGRGVRDCVVRCIA